MAAAGWRRVDQGLAGALSVRMNGPWSFALERPGATLDCAAMRAATASDPSHLQQCYQEYGYTPNGQIAWVKDAKGNRTDYVYDGFDRLKRTVFPSKTVTGQSDASDYEEYSYDANGNLVSKRARDGRVATMDYDALHRLVERTVPGAPGGGLFEFAYDLAGRRVSAYHNNVTIGYEYDAAGRVTVKRHNADSARIRYVYDAAGNVTRLVWPDGWYVSYAYDGLNRVVRACEMIGASACASGGAALAAVSYDAQSRRTGIVYGNGASAGYAYTLRGDLAGQTLDASGSANDAAWDFSYNGAGQLLHKRVDDARFGWTAPSPGADAYASNGLNQYTAVGAASPAYDANGNVATDHHGRAFEYDAANRLTRVRAAPGGATLATYLYDAEGARRTRSGPGFATTRHWHDGDQEIWETESGAWPGAGLRRYLRLPGSVDEPFLTIEYNPSTGAETARRYVHQDRLGSVVALTNASGHVVERFSYGPYGEPGSQPASGFPFRFTGQRLDPETGLYYYKARYYDPETGRFLQTDPIGYEDQMNLYAYVGNDPINNYDPSGLAKCGWNLRGDECTAALEDAKAARENSQAASELLGGIADKVKRGEKLEDVEQKIVDGIGEKFGDEYTSARGLQNLSNGLQKVADTIGAEGEGMVIRRGGYSKSMIARAEKYGFPGRRQNVVTVFSGFRDSTNSNFRQAVLIHEAAHQADLDDYDEYGWPGIGRLRSQDAASRFLHKNPDAYACYLYANDC